MKKYNILIKMIFIFYLFIGIAFSSELNEDLKNPLNERLSIIAISISHKTPPQLLGLEEYATKVYFAKIKNTNEMFESLNLIESNYYKDGYVYLVNAEPGKYVAVATVHTGSTKALTYFDKDLVKATLTEVGEKGLVFMGSFYVQDAESWSFTDPPQSHYRNLLRWHERTVKIGGPVSKYEFYSATLKNISNDAKTKEAFFNAAGKVFNNTGWTYLLNKK
jgi:hypothetical protein